MSIRSYYNGKYRLEKRIIDGEPIDGGYAYEEPILIGCYRRQKTQLVRQGMSQTFSSNASYATEDIELVKGDKIDGMVIIEIDAANANGVKFWRGYV